MSYMLDTNICIALIRKKSQIALNKVTAQSKSDICISIITAAELECGARKRKFSDRQQQFIEQFIISFIVIPFDVTDVSECGVIRAELEAKGTPIGEMDTIIAAQAVARGLTLVTNNVREFSRVPNLVVEDWTV